MSSSTGKQVLRQLRSIHTTVYASKFVKTELTQKVENYLVNATDVVENRVSPEQNLDGWKHWNNTRQNLIRVRRESEG